MLLDSGMSTAGNKQIDVQRHKATLPSYQHSNAENSVHGHTQRSILDKHTQNIIDWNLDIQPNTSRQEQYLVRSMLAEVVILIF
jgi:hypothetical protein